MALRDVTKQDILDIEDILAEIQGDLRSMRTAMEESSVQTVKLNFGSVTHYSEFLTDHVKGQKTKLETRIKAIERQKERAKNKKDT